MCSLPPPKTNLALLYIILVYYLSDISDSDSEDALFVTLASWHVSPGLILAASHPQHRLLLPKCAGPHTLNQPSHGPPPTPSPVALRRFLLCEDAYGISLKRSSYYDSDYRSGAALLRARRPYLVKNTITGLAIFGFAIGVCQETFDDVIVPSDPQVAAPNSSSAETAQLQQISTQPPKTPTAQANGIRS
ncbi:uncharacterized protein Z520_05252 [Fonsecaea multimorphosa CBS 102226]|uniref:Cytochrome c oxidase assembly factor 3 mitochondrial coiled-coil domain-containing protein n=1 Tax=Fonsecaea multimorphosa CBS 102226 TaxID=1442371 RepID=A0A0D2IP89_9EURO|nr:uncharacterized protein Z520_05252 [Fonsecaea multimorphosa CBS 102226]KIX98791.1 hypothetical protein Z520_05252 [Fonsecaea multimorphosa CBS 102226]